MSGQARRAPWNPVMDRRRFLLASLGGLGALALAGCSNRPPAVQGPAVRLPYGALGFPTPFAANADIGYNQLSLIYDSLLWPDGDGKLLNWLAADVQSDGDHLTHTFRLRENVRWSDGRPFTADDVVFTFDYYAEQETFSPPVVIQPPQGIKHVRAVNPLTVEVTLDRPLVTFLGQVAGAMAIIPKHVWSGIEDPAAEQSTKILVGTGAYELTSYGGDGGAMLYTARDDFFLGAPYIKRIEQRPVEDQVAGLLAGQTDEARGMGWRADILAPFQGDQAYGMITSHGSQTLPLYWNLGKEGPLSDVRFRRACVMAIDRQDLVNRLAAGRGLPGSPGFLSPDNPWYAPVRQYDFDPAGANALLDAAGYRIGGRGIRQTATGAPLSFELLLDNEQAPMSELLVGALRRVGVELRPKLVQMGPQLFGNKFVGAYDMAVLLFPGPGPGGPNADPDILRLLFSSEEPPSLQAATAYANPEFNRLAKEQRLEFDRDKRRSAVARMQQILADDVPVLPLFYPEVALIWRKSALDTWYFTPGQYPSESDNKQLFITGMKSGTTIRTNP